MSQERCAPFPAEFRQWDWSRFRVKPSKRETLVKVVMQLKEGFCE